MPSTSIAVAVSTAIAGRARELLQSKGVPLCFLVLNSESRYEFGGQCVQSNYDTRHTSTNKCPSFVLFEICGVIISWVCNTLE